MSIAKIEIQPRVENVVFFNKKLIVKVRDGRIISVPLQWYPRLLHGTPSERADWSIIEDSDARDIIYWEQLDEFIPAIALFTGTPSRESERSFQKWLDSRKRAVQSE